MRLTRYGLRHEWQLVGAYVSLAGVTISAMATPYLLGTAIDEALASGVQRQILLLGSAIVLVSLIRGLFTYGQAYLAESVSQRAAFDLRNDLFHKLQSLSFGFHDRHRTGDMMSRATADVEAVRRLISTGMIRALSGILTVAAVSTILLITNWRLGLVCIVFAPLVIWRAKVLSGQLRLTWMAVQTETGHMTTILQENLSGIRVVKAFGAGEREEARFEQTAAVVASQTYRAGRLSALQGALMLFILTVAIGIILWFGGREIGLERLTAGELAAFMLYMGLLIMPVRTLGMVVNTLARATAAGERIFEVMDSESPVLEKPGAISLPPVQGRVKFEQVSLSYDSSGSVLRDVSFEAEPEQLVAIMGSAGSGKSTIVHLIPRFYDASSGRITIDGFDICDLTLNSLRQKVGIVLQDTFVFAATLRENIAFGVADASLEEVERVAKIAQLHEYVESLPDRYDTWVGERGITLSGGQRQRLAIARTILSNPPILILDDSTSSVDVRTEYLIQQELAELVSNRTTFVIAHRLSTVRMADLILVLEQGEIVQRGTHQELLTQDGLYRRIYELQLRPQEELLDSPGDSS